jgi:hypothetical protein
MRCCKTKNTTAFAIFKNEYVSWELERYVDIQQKKTKAIRNEIQLDGINQFSTPVLTDNPKLITVLMGLSQKKHTILVSG